MFSIDKELVSIGSSEKPYNNSWVEPWILVDSNRLLDSLVV